jgi:pimeloyl-[acyl-carrier protein] methyl ester esterase
MPFIETPTGIKTNYQSQGEGRPLVFIHGWSMSGRVWKYQAEAFSSSYRVILMDLRGHGESAGKEGPFGFEEMASDISDLFRHLDLRGVVLIGWSMGAQAALQSFSLIKDRLSALILVGGTPKFIASDDFPHGLPQVEGRGMAIRLKRNFTKTMGEFFHGMFGEGELGREQYQRIARDIVTGEKLPEPGTALATLDTLVTSDLRSLLPGIDLPVLLVHGSRDTVTMPDASRYMAGRMPNAALEIMNGLGHAPFLSRPDDFNSLLSRFLEKN